MQEINRSKDTKMGVNTQWHWSEFDQHQGWFFLRSEYIIASESEGKKKKKNTNRACG